MAKTDSFFIRKSINFNNLAAPNVFTEESIDLGSFVDPLGKAVLRIFSLRVQWSDSTGKNFEMNDSETAAARFQLTTQTQTSTVLASDKSVIATGAIICSTANFAVVGQHMPDNSVQDLDVSPQDWRNGYLIGVEQIYLGGQATSEFTEDIYASIVLECQVETLSSAKAVALALSQQ